jgi:head-tail adaptor
MISGASITMEVVLDAGEYAFPFYWMQHSSTKSKDMIEDDSYTQVAKLWCAWDTPPTKEVIEDIRRKTRETATLRVRGYPDIVCQDRMISKQWGTVYNIVSITYGFNETILGCESP